ncbi:hypothetical protein P389DRAFT_169113 [Cystobasidium minutum MCA 4210]|uniref:uncharacterized protein n=1 Tax=Cystobasidium minutum MCA 4210 TaxID=1397322 RepID=UPI0034CEE040|eukprot:jgi/Rhomi1/169113/fgenesh1_kg.3_\
MEGFINAAKSAYSEYQEGQNRNSSNNQGGGYGDSQYQQSSAGGQYGQQNYGNNQAGGDFGITGGSRFNQPASAQRINNDFDEDGVLNVAQDDAGDAGDRGLFGQALQFLNNNKPSADDDVDEDRVTSAHQQAYGQGNAGNLDSKSMGSAAALQALKRFTGGQQSPASSSGQSALIGMAMSEASKLFDQSGGAANGNKQDVVNSAVQTIMKFVLKSQLSGAMGTGGVATSGGGSGGVGNLLSMASKFM